MCRTENLPQKREQLKSKKNAERAEHITIAESSDQNIRLVDEMWCDVFTYHLIYVSLEELIVSILLAYIAHSIHKTERIIDERYIYSWPAENDALFAISLINVFVGRDRKSEIDFHANQPPNHSECFNCCVAFLFAKLIGVRV